MPAGRIGRGNPVSTAEPRDTAEKRLFFMLVTVPPRAFYPATTSSPFTVLMVLSRWRAKPDGSGAAMATDVSRSRHVGPAKTARRA